MAGFKITRGTGFHITFENGYTVSVQFGEGNYCDNQRLYVMSNPFEGKFLYEVNVECSNAEVAVISSNELMHLSQFDGGTVGGYFTPEQVLELFNWASKQGAEQ